ncbi:serine/threonine-protein kinase [Sorangium sp. So ce145]|uniref:serine/threonine-protein kinase n=1 Tax=Sorangium sp. So ce145 TaxID=3133285 RepID=UPI003F63B9B8
MRTPAEPHQDETAVISGRPLELEASAAGDALPAGAVVGGYVLDDVRLGGGFGVVHRAVPVGGGAPVALKVLRRGLSLLPAILRRFQREAEVLARLKHPAIVEVRGVGALDDGRPYIAMEWVEGRSLAAELSARGAFSPPEAVALLEEVGGALAAAHAIGVVHRDVKAQNVMVCPGAGGLGAPRVKLVDFGIAKLLRARDVDRARGAKSSSLILGTPLTMAPEQILGGAVDARTDIYAVGLLAYQLVTGELPFQGADAVETEEMHLRAPPPCPSDRAPVSAAFGAVVRRCLAKEPADRYAGVPELLAALRQAVAAPGRQIAAPAARSPVDARLAGACARGPCAPWGPRAALLVEARLSAPDEAGDEALADVERLVQAARAALVGLGATLVVESADALLAALPAPYDRAPERALGWALELWAELGARAGASPEVLPRLALHAAEPEALRGWAPAATGAGVFVTHAFAEGLTGAGDAGEGDAREGEAEEIERAPRPAEGGALRRVAP